MYLHKRKCLIEKKVAAMTIEMEELLPVMADVSRHIVNQAVLL